MRLKTVYQYVVLLFAAGVALFPIFWLISTSTKLPHEWYARPGVWISEAPTLDNYAAIFGLPAPTLEFIGGFAASSIQPIVNSLIAAGGSTAAATIIGYLAAYSISRYNTGGSFLYFFVFTIRMLPPIAVLIPLLVFFSALRLVDTLAGLVIIYLGINVAFVIWIVKGFIDEVPREIEEAAILEGVSRWGLVFKVTLPLVKSGLAAAAIFVFIMGWIEFIVALVMTRSVAFTIPIQLIKFQSVGGQTFGPMAALSTLAIIPTIALAYFIQKQLVKGLTMGAVRGRI